MCETVGDYEPINYEDSNKDTPLSAFNLNKTDGRVYLLDQELLQIRSSSLVYKYQNIGGAL